MFVHNGPVSRRRKDLQILKRAEVNAIVNATGKILATVKMEIEYNKLIGKTPNIDFINSPAQLDGPKETNGKAQRREVRASD